MPRPASTHTHTHTHSHAPAAHTLARSRPPRQLEGYTPGEGVLHRLSLPAADSYEASEGLASPEPFPDTASPASAGGTVLAWVTTSAPLVVRAALVLEADGDTALYMRSVEPARAGNAAWLETCRRLSLPEPPADPTGPPIYGQWAVVAAWARAAGGGGGGGGGSGSGGGAPDVRVIGYSSEGSLWVHDARAKSVSGFEVDGTRVDIALE